MGRIFFCIFDTRSKTNIFMNKVISIESVRRGNAAIMSGKNHGISLDADHVSVCCETAMGNYTMTFERKQIVKAANEAFAKIMK